MTTFAKTETQKPKPNRKTKTKAKSHLLKIAAILTTKGVCVCVCVWDTHSFAETHNTLRIFKMYNYVSFDIGTRPQNHHLKAVAYS